MKKLILCLVVLLVFTPMSEACGGGGTQSRGRLLSGRVLSGRILHRESSTLRVRNTQRSAV